MKPSRLLTLASLAAFLTILSTQVQESEAIIGLAPFAVGMGIGKMMLRLRAAGDKDRKSGRGFLESRGLGKLSHIGQGLKAKVRSLNIKAKSPFALLKPSLGNLKGKLGRFSKKLRRGGTKSSSSSSFGGGGKKKSRFSFAKAFKFGSFGKKRTGKRGGGGGGLFAGLRKLRKGGRGKSRFNLGRFRLG